MITNKTLEKVIKKMMGAGDGEYILFPIKKGNKVEMLAIKESECCLDIDDFKESFEKAKTKS